MKNISVVIPFYKKIDEFKFSFENYNGKWFYIHNVELILVSDEPTQTDEIVEYAKNIELTLKVINNPNEHEWRNPYLPLNYGLKYSTREKIMVMSPESCFWNDAIEHLDRHCEEGQFSVGSIKFSTYDQRNILQHSFPYNYYDFMGNAVYYGSICFRRQDGIAIGGYDTFNGKWGGDDDNFRARLRNLGIKKIKTDAKLIHYDRQDRVEESKSKEWEFTNEFLKWAKYPNYWFSSQADVFKYNHEDEFQLVYEHKVG